MSSGRSEHERQLDNAQHQQDALGAAQVAAAAAQDAANAAHAASRAAHEALAPETVLAGPDSHTHVQVPAAIVEIEINLASVVRRLIRGRWLVAGMTLLGLVLSVADALLAKPYFESQAVFLPPKLSQAPTALIIGGSDPSDLYLGLLASRSVQSDVLDRLNLVKVLGAKNRGEAFRALIGMTKTSVTRNELITVTVHADDPELAARIANTYLEALYSLNGRMVASASAHRAQFFEAQLEEQKNELAQAEFALAQTQKQTGVSPTSEVQIGLNQTAGLEAEINAAEARLTGLETSYTDQAPEVVTARAQLAQLRAQLARQLSDSGSSKASGLPSNGALPELSLEYTRREREVKLRETVFDNLVEEYEKARLAAIDPGPQLEIVDRAVPADHKAGPSRRNIVTVGVLLGFFLAAAYLLLMAPFRRLLVFVRESAHPEPRSSAPAATGPRR